MMICIYNGLISEHYTAKTNISNNTIYIRNHKCININNQWDYRNKASSLQALSKRLTFSLFMNFGRSSRFIVRNKRVARFTP